MTRTRPFVGTHTAKAVAIAVVLVAVTVAVAANHSPAASVALRVPPSQRSKHPHQVLRVVFFFVCAVFVCTVRSRNYYYSDG